jgi:DNA-directed RNA polymerase subunit beta
MQSLALDVNVVSEEGTRAEMGDEDDDLLRAAEELGIDLSGVRAATGEVSDVPADETLVAEAEEPQDAPADIPVEDIDIDADVDIAELATDDEK